MTIEIKHRHTCAVLYRAEAKKLKEAVEAAVRSYADLSYADLRVADLSGADLGYADLRVANLRSANLSGADLSYADLRVADLSGANLRSANLRYANLSGADLSGADLSGADLSGADLGYANLRSANLRSANLSGADLRVADLSGADLISAKTVTADGDPLTLIGPRPIIQIGPIGSRSDYLLAWMTDRGVYIRAGCFWGSLEAFRAAVTATHGAGVHAQEYQAAIALIECHAALWPAEAAAQEAAA